MCACPAGNPWLILCLAGKRSNRARQSINYGRFIGKQGLVCVCVGEGDWECIFPCSMGIPVGEMRGARTKRVARATTVATGNSLFWDGFVSEWVYVFFFLFPSIWILACLDERLLVLLVVPKANFTRHAINHAVLQPHLGLHFFYGLFMCSAVQRMYIL